MALLATFVTGVLAAAQPVLAAAAGVLVVVLLVSRAPLHGFAHQKLSEQELRDAVLLAAAAILVLPILPDHPIDPWQVVNPRLVWKLTVLIMLVDAAGYVAQRLVGARAGLPISGLLGGFVSSTAVVATMGKRAQGEPEVLSAASPAPRCRRSRPSSSSRWYLRSATPCCSGSCAGRSWRWESSRPCTELRC